MSTTSITEAACFHVFQRGELTIIGIEGKHLAVFSNAADCRSSLLRIVDETGCQILAVDLMDVVIVASWILGGLAAIGERGIEVHLYNTSAGIGEVLSITSLDRRLSVRGLSALPIDYV